MKQFKELKLGDKLGVIKMKSDTICEYEVKDLALVNKDSVNIIYNFNGDNFTVYKHLPLTIYNNTMFFPLENYNEFIYYAQHFFKEHTITELKNNIKTLFRL